MRTLILVPRSCYYTVEYVIGAAGFLLTGGTVTTGDGYW